MKLHATFSFCFPLVLAGLAWVASGCGKGQDGGDIEERDGMLDQDAGEWDVSLDAPGDDWITGDIIDDSRAGMGPGTGNEYNPVGGNSNGVSTNDSGWLVLDTENVGTEYLWASNSGEGTVSKVDVQNDAEVGRFYSGLDARNADPSRTSVDLAGDVFVGNRAHNYPPDTQFRSSLTKIAAQPSRCIDRDGDTVIETSTGPAPLPRNDGSDPDVPVGQSTDECVVWTRDLSVERYGCLGLRAVAATSETGLDFEVNGHVWAGCWKNQALYKLHGNTGEVLAAYELPVCAPYGFVLDDSGRLWVSCRDGWRSTDPKYGAIAWIETATGQEHVIPPIYDNSPSGWNVPNPYGIAIDSEGKVYITTFEGDLYRYDEAAGWSHAPTLPPALKGVAVDEEGWVYVISKENSHVYLFDPASLSILEEWDASDGINTTNEGTGVAVDFSGDLWAVTGNYGNPHGWVTHFSLDRSGTHPVSVGILMVPIGNEPYTYSDMIGYNLRHFTTREGWYNHLFETCPGFAVRWKEIAWEANVPPGTSIVIRARTANHIEDIESAEWMTLARVPDDVSPVEIPSTLPEGHFIEIEVRLYTTMDGLTPEVGAITFDWECTYPIL